MPVDTEFVLSTYLLTYVLVQPLTYKVPPLCYCSSPLSFTQNTFNGFGHQLCLQGSTQVPKEPKGQSPCRQAQLVAVQSFNMELTEHVLRGSRTGVALHCSAQTSQFISQDMYCAP